MYYNLQLCYSVWFSGSWELWVSCGNKLLAGAGDLMGVGGSVCNLSMYALPTLFIQDTLYLENGIPN